MTQTFATTSDTNDIYLGTDGNLAVLSGQTAVLAACATASTTQLGECVLAVNAGIPNFQAIWVGVPNYAIWKQALTQTLQNVQGVVQVKNLQLSTRDNTLSYTATISNQFGQAEMQSALT